VLGVFLDIIFFGMMGYWSWNYIFKTPDAAWLVLPIAWVLLCSSLLTPAFKIYHFAKSLYSKPIETDTRETPRSQSLVSSSEQVRESIKNVFDDLPQHSPKEVVQTLIRAADVRIERIISHGHASAPDFWYDQPQHEWVIVLKGATRLQFEDSMVEMKVGDFINIPAFKKHRVDWTTPDEPTVWLGVRYGDLK